MRKVIGMYGCIAVASMALVATAAERSAERTSVDRQEAHQTKHDLASGLTGANQGLPRMIDEDIRLDRISTYPDPVVVYHYTFIKYPGQGQSRSNLRDTIELKKPQTIKELCADASLRKLVDAKYAIIYRYYDKHGQRLFDTFFQHVRCNA